MNDMVTKNTVYLTKKGKMTSNYPLAKKEGIQAKKIFVWKKSRWYLDKTTGKWD